jgi:nucleoside phosphorylase
MEGAGIAYACSASGYSKMLIVKGIMDKSDKKTRATTTRDEWKDYAAAVSSQFVKELIREL